MPQGRSRAVRATAHVSGCAIVPSSESYVNEKLGYTAYDLQSRVALAELCVGDYARSLLEQTTKPGTAKECDDKKSEGKEEENGHRTAYHYPVVTLGWGMASGSTIARTLERKLQRRINLLHQVKRILDGSEQQDAANEQQDEKENKKGQQTQQEGLVVPKICCQPVYGSDYALKYGRFSSMICVSRPDGSAEQVEARHREWASSFIYLKINTHNVSSSSVRESLWRGDFAELAAVLSPSVARALCLCGNQLYTKSESGSTTKDDDDSKTSSSIIARVDPSLAHRALRAFCCDESSNNSSLSLSMIPDNYRLRKHLSIDENGGHAVWTPPLSFCDFAAPNSGRGRPVCICLRPRPRYASSVRDVQSVFQARVFEVRGCELYVYSSVQAVEQILQQQAQAQQQQQQQQQLCRRGATTVKFVIVCSLSEKFRAAFAEYTEPLEVVKRLSRASAAAASSSSSSLRFLCFMGRGMLADAAEEEVFEFASSHWDELVSFASARM